VMTVVSSMDWLIDWIGKETKPKRLWQVVWGVLKEARGARAWGMTINQS